MQMRRYSGKLFLSFVLILWANFGYAFYPFCEDVNIVYLGKPGSLVEQWAVVFQGELKRHFEFRNKVAPVAAVDLGIRAATVNKDFKAGKLDIAIVPAAIMARTVPSFRILKFPGFVARDYEIEALQSKRKFLRKLEVIAAERGVPLLGVGWRFTTLTYVREKTIATLLDLKGTNIRVAYKEQNAVVVALGANAVQMPSAEVSIALQRGLIDGTISTFSYAIELAKQKSIKSIVTFERGGFDSIAYVLVMRKELFRKPDDEARDKIRKAAQSASKRFTLFATKEREAFIGGLGKLGVKVNMLKKNEYKIYQSKLEENVWPKLIWGTQARDLLQLRKKDIE